MGEEMIGWLELKKCSGMGEIRPQAPGQEVGGGRGLGSTGREVESSLDRGKEREDRSLVGFGTEEGVGHGSETTLYRIKDQWKLLITIKCLEQRAFQLIKLSRESSRLRPLVSIGKKATAIADTLITISKRRIASVWWQSSTKATATRGEMIPPILPTALAVP
ncbi:hypothetical protein IEQ34_011433 [Dendrobium chrysotoxum]|uniref:Uncharacterized protein n=1 Tax=Dendrobium chrysotoxum TaxID=161865 RepID=A0AAV7GSA9_DENCH|nr:hypothetical protein IEQ34_011433 [Dendrobium chrysotoxum]